MQKFLIQNEARQAKKETLKTEGEAGESGSGGDRGIVDDGGGNLPLLPSMLPSGKFLLNGFKLRSFLFNSIYFGFGTFFKNF